MNYSALRKADIANGIGFRCTLWCCGCRRKCPGCFNPEAQDPNFGEPFTDEVKERIFKELSEPTCDGLSLMGGEPLSICSDNRKQTIQLCKEVKERFPNKSVWIWTGYLFEEIASDPSMKEILNYVDIIVDGPFIQEKRDLSTPFRGSTNQRIIKVDEWRRTGNVVEMEFGN